MLWPDTSSGIVCYGPEKGFGTSSGFCEDLEEIVGELSSYPPKFMRAL